MNYWRIGYGGEPFKGKPQMLKFFAKCPFVWGNGVNGGIESDGSGTDKGGSYIPYLEKVAEGDILVAGGVKYINFIGRAIARPTYIDPKGEFYKKDDLYFQAHGISKETNKDIQDAGFGLCLEDMVCIKTEWFYMDRLHLNTLQFPHPNPMGGFHQIKNDENIEYISKLMGSAISEI